MNTPVRLAALVIGCSAFAAPLAAAPAPAPILFWGFNEGMGDYAGNHGTGGEAPLYLQAPGGGALPAFSVDGRGVSGKPGDHALDFTSATGMGATTPNSTGPAGVVWSSSSGLASLSGLSSFTLSGWIQPTATVTAAARIVSSASLTLMAGVENRITLQVNGVNATEQSDPAYHEIGAWIFFAVTYDGTRDIDNVTYYVGSTAEGSLAPAGTVTVAAGKLKPFTGQLLVGNNSTHSATTRPFMGLMDQIAIHASQDDASGVLTVEQLEALRAAATR